MAQAKRHRWTGMVLGGFGILLVAAGCGGGTPTHTTTPAASQSAKSVVVSTAQSSAHGTILASGNTLYTLKSPSQTPCTAACLKIWPALLLPAGATAAVAGSGVDATKLGTTASGSALQVTYDGQPLYYFSEDTAPGQVNGNVTDVWGTWSDVVIAAPGAAAAGTAAPTTVAPGTAPASKASSPTSSPANGGTSATTAPPSQTATSMAPSTTRPSSTATTRTTRTTATTAPPTTTRVTTTTAPPTTQASTTTTTVLSGGGGF